jgi:hypothetical protein
MTLPRKVIITGKLSISLVEEWLELRVRCQDGVNHSHYEVVRALAVADHHSEITRTVGSDAATSPKLATTMVFPSGSLENLILAGY